MFVKAGDHEAEHLGGYLPNWGHSIARNRHGRSTMATLKLEKTEWHPYFDRISKALVGKRAEIEIASLSLGHQIAAEWLPLLGLPTIQRATFWKSPSTGSTI